MKRKNKDDSPQDAQDAVAKYAQFTRKRRDLTASAKKAAIAKYREGMSRRG